MSDELRKKLKDIHKDDWNCIGHSEGQLCCLEHDDVIERIEQAFVEDGWVKTLRINDKTIVLNGKDPLGQVVYYPDLVMTGKEWFDTFYQIYLAEHTNPKTYEPDKLEWTHILDAARRAAGLEGGEDETDSKGL